MKFLAWLLSLFIAFSLGANNSATQNTESDEELRNRVQQHLDVIADESAAIVDDVTESLRGDERVQQAEQFAKDVEEVARETWDDVSQAAEDAKTRVQEKFGKNETAESPAEAETEAAPGVDQEPGTESQEPAKDAGADEITAPEDAEAPGVDQEAGTETLEPGKDSGADGLEGEELPETPAGEVPELLLPELTPGQDPFNG